METCAEGQGLAAGVEDDAAVEALAGHGAQRLDAAEVAGGDLGRRLDLHAHDPAGAVFEDDVDLLSGDRAEVEEVISVAKGGQPRRVEAGG